MQKNKIKKLSKEVLQYEIDALKNLKRNINESFIKVVKTILSCKDGKIVISVLEKVE